MRVTRWPWPGSPPVPATTPCTTPCTRTCLCLCTRRGMRDAPQGYGPFVDSLRGCAPLELFLCRRCRPLPQALRALGVCTFVCMEPERVDAFLRQCEALCCARGVGAHIRRQALQSWSLAASALLLHNPDAKRTAQGLIDR